MVKEENIESNTMSEAGNVSSNEQASSKENIPIIYHGFVVFDERSIQVR